MHPEPKLQIKNWKLPIFLLLIIFFINGCAHQNQGQIQDPAALTPLRHELLQDYQNWRGTPHRLGGNNQNGIDCSAYTQRVYKKLFAIQLPRLAKEQRRSGNGISSSQLQTGDLVFFRPGIFSNHVGVYLGDGSFIHVSSSKGVTRSRLDKGYWKKRFHSARRVLSF